MLKDEEKQEIIDKYHTDKNYDLWDAFDAIERAVLAKAGEQEPVGYVATDEISNGKVHGYASLCGSKSDSANTPVYLHPLPAQAIPDKIGSDSAISKSYKKGWNDCIDVMLSASPKP